MTKYGKLMGSNIETITGAAWQKLYHAMQKAGYTTDGKLPLSQYLSGSHLAHEQVANLIDKYSPTKYYIKPVLSSSNNIVFFVKEHTYPAFSKKNEDHEKYANSMIRGMKYGGYEIVGRFIDDMLRQPLVVQNGDVVHTFNVTDSYEIHYVFREQSKFPLKEDSGVGLNPSIEVDFEGNPIQQEVDTEYKRRINDRYDKQYNKGKEKYNVVLEENKDIGFMGRLDHLADELIDGLQYVEHNRDLMGAHKKEVINAITDIMILVSTLPTQQQEGLRGVAKRLNESLKTLMGE